MRLQNRKALITGANRSIGKGIAIAFAKQGADVVIQYRSDEKGALETLDLIQACGRDGKALYADFKEPHASDTLFDEAQDFLGEIDILVNCAAGYDTTSFLELSPERFELLFHVGVLTPMRLIQKAAKRLIEIEKPGSVINISSISGNRPYLNRTAHSNAKAALNMLTQSAALELAPYNIRVNAIAPGATPYEGDHAPSMIKEIPLNRAGLPEDQANAAIFLASNDSAWMTGQILTIDGGQSLSF